MPHEALKLIEILDIIEKTLELEPAGPNRKTLIAFIHAVRDEAKAEVERFEEDMEEEYKKKVIH